MIKISALLTRRADLTHQEFLDYWTQKHTPMVASLPGGATGVAKYTQLLATEDGIEGIPTAPYDGVAELWVDSVEDAAAWFTGRPTTGSSLPTRRTSLTAASPASSTRSSSPSSADPDVRVAATRRHPHLLTFLQPEGHDMDVITVAVHGPTIDRSDDTEPTLVVLHGYGSNERDLTGLVPMVGPDLPWVSLRGPVELAGDAAAWFRVAPQGPLPGAVEDATTTLWNWIDGNLRDRPIVPIGFSQGGSMALQLVRTRPDRIAAAAVLSGFLHAAPDEHLDPARYRPPVFWGRGDVDPLVDPARVALTEPWLLANTEAETHVYPGLGHAISRDEVRDLASFLGRKYRAAWIRL